MKKVVVLMDGGHARPFLKRWRKNNTPQPVITAADHVSLGMKCITSASEDLIRIHYYDCLPYTGQEVNPISGTTRDFTADPGYRYHTRLFEELCQKPSVAFRSGQLKFRGWRLTDKCLATLKTNPRPLTDADFEPVLQQKGVDIKLGVDIATLAHKKLVDRIILFTADTDFIPAMKLARREGLQVIYASLAAQPHRDFLEHSDDFRQIIWP